MDTFKHRIAVILRHFEDNPALGLCVLAIFIAVAFAILVIVDVVLHRRKLLKEKEMYTGKRTYPIRRDKVG